jgi:heme/copper-type cytochrome/quinol oxidase subunit 3
MQYATLAQQGETAQFGMWVFIATETLFFGVLIFSGSRQSSGAGNDEDRPEPVLGLAERRTRGPV